MCLRLLNFILSIQMLLIDAGMNKKALLNKNTIF